MYSPYRLSTIRRIQDGPAQAHVGEMSPAHRIEVRRDLIERKCGSDEMLMRWQAEIDELELTWGQALAEVNMEFTSEAQVDAFLFWMDFMQANPEHDRIADMAELRA